MSLVTIFITPKGFDREHIAIIQRNAVRSWKMLGEDVDILLIGDDEGVEENAKALGVRYVREVKRNSHGTPLLSDIFRIARENSDSPLLAYVNADILLKQDFLQTCREMHEKEKQFLLVGRRFDLDVETEMEFGPDWEEKLDAEVAARGNWHSFNGSDYFIFTRDIYTEIPDFAIGRSGWDNWMFYEARAKGWKLVDCTGSINIVHQNHDYAHLPNGLSHHRQPESAENVAAAGGKQNIYQPDDCNYVYGADRTLRKAPMTGQKFIREGEIFCRLKLKSQKLGNFIHRFVKRGQKRSAEK